MKCIENKVFEIMQTVNNNSSRVVDNYGLLSGLAGEILFLYYYEKFYGKQDELNLELKIEVMIESLKRYNSTPSFCSGISGVLYLTELLNQEQIIDFVLDDEIYNYMNKAIQYYISNNDFEFLYGLTGLAQYLLLRPDKYMNLLLDIVNYIDNSKTIVDNTYAWKKSSDENNIEVDLALSHGMSSIVYFLSRFLGIVKNQNEKNKVKDLIRKSCNFILSKQNVLTNNIYSYFPYAVSLSKESQQSNSRLAWCYGDLSIGITLFNAGKALQDNFISNSGELILKYSAINRRDLSTNLVQDPGICHGAAGIASIFYRMWWNTRDVTYLEATNYWINETLQMGRNQNGIAGYVYTKSNHILKGFHLLEGVSGIALSMLFISLKQEPVWDRCIMIS